MKLAPVRQAELHSDLKLQEKDELQWKKLKVEGLDESGEREAQLRRNFNGETNCVDTFHCERVSWDCVSQKCTEVS